MIDIPIRFPFKLFEYYSALDFHPIRIVQDMQYGTSRHAITMLTKNLPLLKLQT